MIFSNSRGSVSRPFVLTMSWKSVPFGAGSAPSLPAATCTFCAVTAAITSPGISPRENILSGSSHRRMEYWLAPKTDTLPTPSMRLSTSWICRMA